MVRLPEWLVLLVGSLVVVFGAYRLYLSFRSPAEEERAQERGGIYGYGRRRQLLYGVIYALLGGMLVAGALGLRMPWQAATPEPAPSAEPRVIPIQ